MFAPLREAHPGGCRTTGLGFSLRLENTRGTRPAASGDPLQVFGTEVLPLRDPEHNTVLAMN